MQLLVTFVVAAYLFLYACAFPLSLSFSRGVTFPTLSPPSSIKTHTKELLSSAEAARTYLEESMFAFTASEKGSSAVRISLSERPVLGENQKHMNADMQKRVKEWMGVLGVERCGDALGCE